jgi:DNA-binding MarR family transcriptional regulator
MTPRWAKIAVMSYAERMAARREKERKVLAFLRREIWTTPRVLAVLLQWPDGQPGDKAVVSRLIQSLKRQGLVETETIDNDKFVIGITADGQARAAEIINKELVLKEYERGRVSLSTFQHREDLQLLHIQCAKRGWAVFTYPDRLPVDQKLRSSHRPDVLTVTPFSQSVALECERTIKSMKRYAVIIGGHLTNIQQGLYGHVIYATPDQPRAKAVQKIFHEIGRVVVQGKDVPLTEKEREKFSFLTYDQVPSFGQKEH